MVIFLRINAPNKTGAPDTVRLLPFYRLHLMQRQVPNSSRSGLRLEANPGGMSSFCNQDQLSEGSCTKCCIRYHNKKFEYQMFF